MCGRTSLFVPLNELETRFDAQYVADQDYRPRFNIEPHQPIEVIPNEADEIDQYTWGLLPPWSDDLSDGFINARSETAHEKRSFKDAWENRPCLVLSSGFYEWQKSNGGPNQPYRIYREDDVAFAMAGLWAETEVGDETVRSITILTTEPNEIVEPIHDRMPVVLTSSEEDRWLDADPDERRELCRPYPDVDLAAYEIDTGINNPENDDPSVIEPAERSQSEMGEFGA